MQNKKEETEVKIKDFYGACLLKALDYRLLRLEQGDGDFMVFVFHDADFAAEEMLGRYWDRNVSVDAKTLVDSIRDLKTMLHAGASRG